MALIESLLPEGTVAVETCDDLPDAALLPPEQIAVARAVPARRREFATGRACARLALERLGFQPVAIPVGEHGEPLWPPGVVGSITHCRGYRACAVAAADAFLALGIDVEPNVPLPEGLWEEVAHGPEREHPATARLASGESVHLDRLRFSAKEAVYKALFPITRSWLGFEDVELEIGTGGIFRAAVRVPGPVVSGVCPSVLDGRWGLRKGLIATAVAIATRSG